MKSNEIETTIVPGDFVLIEGDDEERPFVAILKELYDDGKKICLQAAFGLLWGYFKLLPHILPCWHSLCA